MELSTLEMGLITLVTTFQKYAWEGHGKGSSETLNKGELKNLLANELPHLMEEGGEKVDELIAMLDQDADGSLDFMEYLTLVGSLASMVHKMM